MSPHYFPISKAQDDLQRWIPATDTLGAIYCSHNAASSTKERVEPMILRIIAVDIPHSYRFTLLLLLRIRRYICKAGLNEREAPGKVVTARPPKRLAQLRSVSHTSSFQLCRNTC